jgi:hypothetical protein
MSKMGLNDPFGHLKHKLWPKEGLGVKLPIWLPTTKSQESTRFTCVQVTCDISLESSRQRLQLCFRTHLNPRFACEVMGPKIARVPTLAILGLPLGNPGTKCHLDVGLVERHIIYYKGEGDGFPQVQAMVIFVSPSYLWFILASKVLQLCTNHLVLVLCRFVWAVEACQFFIVPFWSSNMPLYPSKVLWARQHALTLYSSAIFSLDSHLSPSRSWDRVIATHYNNNRPLCKTSS